MGMKVKEVAELVGVSIRALHHYDQIGLLTPKEITDSGYRLYSEDNLETLQQILFFKELGFTLKEIKKIINSPSFNQQEALILQRKMLIEKRRKVDKMIDTIDKTIKHMAGVIQMTNEERFGGNNVGFNQFEEEARLRWGNQSIDEIKAKLRKSSKMKKIIYLKEGIRISINLHVFLINPTNLKRYKQQLKNGMIF